MAEPTVQCCPLCLAADEVESMVLVPIRSITPGEFMPANICRPCARAVSEAMKAIDEVELGDAVLKEAKDNGEA